MVKVLFVCRANICRSPAGEGILKHLVKEAGLTPEQVHVESAGVSAYEGDHPDNQMRAHSLKRGYDLTNRAQRFTQEFLTKFDYIITMDSSVHQRVVALDPAGEFKNKVSLWEIPDPYAGGAEGFEHVLDLVETGCRVLLSRISDRL